MPIITSRLSKILTELFIKLILFLTFQCHMELLFTFKPEISIGIVLDLGERIILNASSPTYLPAPIASKYLWILKTITSKNILMFKASNYQFGPNKITSNSWEREGKYCWRKDVKERRNFALLNKKLQILHDFLNKKWQTYDHHPSIIIQYY